MEKDLLYGKNIAAGSYGVMGFQWGFNDTVQGGKTPTTAAPMSINGQPIGLGAIDDELWNKTFGCSMDGYLSLINGINLASTKTAVLGFNDTFKLNGNFDLAFPSIKNSNIYEKISINDKEVQQVQYVASKATASDAASSISSYGEVEDVRTIGIRSPLMSCGWGKTVALRPTDPAPSSPTVENDDAHKLDRAGWKSGHVDWRWDSRRGVWAAWNDMIVDERDSSPFGTLVFGANSLIFPALVATWSDAFVVRTNITDAGFIPVEPSFDLLKGSPEYSKTAEIYTHLDHGWFDKTTNITAPLNSIFTIVDNACHSVGDEITIGDDVKRVGDSIDLKSTVHFNTGQKDGPISFNDNLPTVGTVFVGDMFNFDPAGCGPWRPAITFTDAGLCQLIGEPIGELVWNDQNLATRQVAFCNNVFEWIEQLHLNVEGQLLTGDGSEVDLVPFGCIPPFGNVSPITNIIGYNCDVAHTVDCLMERDKVIKQRLSDHISLVRELSILDDSRVVNNLSVAVFFALQELTNNINNALQNIALQLAENCSCFVAPPVIQSPSLGVDPFDVTNPPAIFDIPDCDSPLLEIPEFSCDLNCRPIVLNAPCTDRDKVSIGRPCLPLEDWPEPGPIVGIPPRGVL